MIRKYDRIEIDVPSTPARLLIPGVYCGEISVAQPVLATRDRRYIQSQIVVLSVRLSAFAMLSIALNGYKRRKDGEWVWFLGKDQWPVDLKVISTDGGFQESIEAVNGVKL